MPCRIVVVEDDADVRKVLELALECKGYKVESAVDGQHGFELISKVIPDLAILDVKMPRMNGFELLVKLRQTARFKELPILMLTSLTAGGNKTDEQWRDSLDVTAFLSKPFETNTLLETVESVLAQQRLHP